MEQFVNPMQEEYITFSWYDGSKIQNQMVIKKSLSFPSYPLWTVAIWETFSYLNYCWKLGVKILQSKVSKKVRSQNRISVINSGIEDGEIV